MAPQPTTVAPAGKLRQKIECLMLDIYGTLFISASGDIGIARKSSKNAWQLKQLLRKFNIQIPAESLLTVLFDAIEREHEKLRQSGIDYPEIKIEEIWKQILDQDDPDQVKAFAVEFEIIANPVYPMPHLTDMLAECKNRAKLLGIISNAQFFTPLLFEWFLDAGLTELGFDPELIFLSYQHKQAKPSTFLFGLAADQLERKGIPKEAVLYLGNDMLNDIYPAHSVGFNTALFAGDARSLRMRENDPRCRDVAPDLVITDLIQILDHV